MSNGVAVATKPEAKKKKKASPLGVILNILCVLALLACIVLAINMRGEREGMLGPQILGTRAFKALSSSMSPTIEIGGLILVREKPVEKIEVGDILTYQAVGSEAVVTHRVIEVEEADGQRQFITRGDANGSNDVNPVTQDRIIGVVVMWFNGYDQLSSPKGIIMLGIIVLLVFMVIPTLIAKVWRLARGDS